MMGLPNHKGGIPMKRKITVIAALLLTVVLTAALTSAALASDGSMTITIHPIRILVNV